MNSAVKLKNKPFQKSALNTRQSKQRFVNRTVSKTRHYSHLTQTLIIVEGLELQSHMMFTLDEYKHSQFINFPNENHLQQATSKCQRIERT
jgi:hypothetical protein